VRDHSPPKTFGFEDAREHSIRSRGRQPDRRAHQSRSGDSFEVQQVQLSVTPCNVRHGWHRGTRIGKSDVLAQLEKAEDGSLLLGRAELLERTGQVTPSTGYRRATSSVVPVRRREHAGATPPPRESDQQLFDEQAVIEDDDFRRHQSLLVDEVRIGNRREALLVALRQHAPQFTSSCRDTTRDDERGVTEVDESDFATLLDSPPTAQFGGQIRLASM
jgi:hypothetical protein